MPSPVHAPARRRIDLGVPGCRHALIGIVLLGLAAVSVAGQESVPTTPLPAVTATWSGVPLRTVARRLGDLARRPVILDRRLDPDTSVTLDIRDAALVDVLEQIALPLGASCAVLQTSIRIVPGRAAATLVASDAERTRVIAALPLVSRRLAGRRAPWAWEDGARPHDLIERLADEAGIDLTGLDDIPHDHLAAAELPALPLAERLDLLLSQFDRRIDWQPARGESERMGLAIVPLPSKIPPGDSAVIVAANAARGGPSVVPPPRSGGSRRPPAGPPTWTLEVAAPLDQLLQTIATRMELELELDREGLRTKGIAPAEIVRLSVKDVDRDALLDRIVMPLGLEWAIDGRVLRVGPTSE